MNGHDANANYDVSTTFTASYENTCKPWSNLAATFFCECLDNRLIRMGIDDAHLIQLIILMNLTLSDSHPR